MGINKINIKNNGDSMNGHLSVQTHDRVSLLGRISQPYPKYKNSNIPWLGEIPEHWEVRKLKSTSKIVNGATPSTSNEENWDGDILWITPAEINNITFISDSIRKITKKGYESCGTFIIPKNSIVLTTRAPIGKLVITKAELCTNQGCKSIIPLESDTKFLFYQLSVRTKELNALGTGTTFMELGGFELKNLPIISPKREEQTAIARFLDYKLAKINRFIRKKKQLITLLNEQKAAIINQAVTKGIKSTDAMHCVSTKMKDSGIEWLGEIPEHWEVRKLKYVADVVLGKMLCNEDKGGYFKKPYLKSKNIQWLNVDISDVEEMWFSNSELEIYRLKKGDLIVSEGGEVGKTCIWNDELDECYIQNSAHKVNINSRNLNTYFLYLFNTYGKKGGFDSIVNRVSIAHLTKDKLINIKCLVPPLSEQQQIVSYIEQETATINTTISTIEKEIALVEEYKTALIAEAVTGKIDVRGYEIPEITEEDFDYAQSDEMEIEEEISMAAEDAEAYQTVEE